MGDFINEYFSGLLQPALQYLWTNYDYCYLKAMHEKNRNVGCKTIIAGSSHAMNGIVEKEMPKSAINFSISSQDVYFDFLNVKRAIEEGRQRIENCVINIGYYMLYQDLSLSTTMGYLMSSVYGPLFARKRLRKLQTVCVWVIGNSSCIWTLPEHILSGRAPITAN